MFSLWISVVVISLSVCQVFGDVNDVKESDSVLHDYPGKHAPRRMPAMPKKQLPMPDPINMSEEELLTWDLTAFSKRDRDNNSFIEEDEIFHTMTDAVKAQETMKLTRSNTPPEQVEQRLAEILQTKEEDMRKTAHELLEKDDSNKDGKVSLDEFSAARKLHFEEMKRKNEL